jgi:uncharacterized membrane protein YkvA (DUF1232 family)
MSFKLTIELSDRDLRHFRRELRRARESVSIADDEEILAAAADMVAKLRATELPDFIAERLAKLEILQTMLGDADWPLAKDERGPVLAALAYVCDPEDIIPDEVPGIGLLDDAGMIELVLRDLRHTIESYADFCAYRKMLPRRLPGRRDPATVAHMLEQRREQLMERMRRRRAAEQR